MPFVKLFFQEWRGLLLGFFLSFICLLAGVGLLSLSGWLICAAASAGITIATGLAFNYFIPAAGIRFLALTRIVSRYGERVFNHSATFNILRDLRVWCYQKIEPLAPAHFYKYSGGDLLQRFVGDIDALDNLYLRVLSPLLNVFLLSCVVLIFLHFFDIKIAWLVFLLVLLTIFLSLLLSFSLGKKLGAECVSMLSRMRLQVVTNIQNAKTFLLFGQLKHFLGKFNQLADEYDRAQFKMSIIQGFSLGLVTLMSGVTIVVVLWVGLPLVHHHRLSGAILGLIVLTIMGVFEVITPLPKAFQYLGQTEKAARRVTEVTSSKPTVNFPEKSLQSIQLTDIEIDQVSFQYPGQYFQALQDISLNVSSGSRIAIVGETGAGKTTLMRLLTRSWDPDQGVIKIGGVPLNQLTENKLRQLVVMAFQRTHIFNATLRDNLRLAKTDATDKELWHVLELVLLKETIEQYKKGLDTSLGEFGANLSGGQIKRIGLARAILSGAPIIILDEPSEGLDKQTFSTIWSAMQKTLKDRTLIIITHQLHEFTNLNHVYKLRNGVLID